MHAPGDSFDEPHLVACVGWLLEYIAVLFAKLANAHEFHERDFPIDVHSYLGLIMVENANAS